MYLTILIPCLNEEKTIEFCIKKALKFLNRQNFKYEILIVDNGSTDNTVRIAKKNGARVVGEKIKGYGSALIAGIKNAKGKFIIMGDADGSYDFSNLDSFIEKFNQGYDLVCGNRFKGGIQKGAMPFLHKFLGNPLLSFLGRLFYKVKLGDFHCGLKGFRKDAISKLKLSASGMEFTSELLTRAVIKKLKISEVAVKLFRDRRNRKPHLNTWSDGWKNLTYLFYYSPKWLFSIPGKVLFIFGTLLSLLTIKGTFVVSENLYLDVFTLYAGCTMMLIGSQMYILGFYSQIIKKNDNYQFSKFNLNLLMIALASIIIAFVGIYLSINYWLTNEPLLVNFKILGRYFVPSITLILFSFQIIMDVILFNFLKKVSK
tara:strand:+ start:941 stop:2056 length:1116 start_codon:yes stop_codon:yes gene_type:complete